MGVFVELVTSVGMCAPQHPADSSAAVRIGVLGVRHFVPPVGVCAAVRAHVVGVVL